MAALIALDWGTSSLRGFLMDQDGRVLETRASRHGIQNLPASGTEGFEQAFVALCGEWVERLQIQAAVACGMVGSAQGWREAPYVPCPADTHSLASKAVSVKAPLGVEIMIAPGLSYDPVNGRPDVMRGEEIQIAGALGDDADTDSERLIVLPGTHSKWVEVRDGSIEAFHSYMTGELFSALRRATILGRLMPDGEKPTPDVAAEAFAKGVKLALESGPGDLAHQIFSARTLGLFGRIEHVALADYLSGIVIGHELVSARSRFDARITESVSLPVIGDGDLCARYVEGIRIACDCEPILLGNTAPAGLYRFAEALGLFSSASLARASG
ncbi:MAG: 2-keto-3-deoxy-galactonokinase [Rhizobiaceae bacterium]|nr:2-keto-3-deoxy-galactonokinase [Rhizobiaceae bacterium]